MRGPLSNISRVETLSENVHRHANPQAYTAPSFELERETHEAHPRHSATEKSESSDAVPRTSFRTRSNTSSSTFLSVSSRTLSNDTLTPVLAIIAATMSPAATDSRHKRREIPIWYLDREMELQQWIP